ncbi:hypothetical protein SETIT_3G298000v2 [Setaria italica]|uniref:Knottins-like domain-containing protein n=2 Tax=Setaria TaxID=4554 RepID=A0A368QKA8_SETIT|nr:hypothetical protein SETIT_3G298000v2 [Setaria italica]TKW28161.1 hypothetical protein SEVIR_3G329200v2 [Setaria viridis]
MKPPRMNLSAAAVVAVVLLIVLAGDMAPVEALCSHLSGDFKGWCTSTRKCQNVCLLESYDNIDGKCQGWFPARCWCISNICSPAAAAAPETGGGGASARGDIPHMNE